MTESNNLGNKMNTQNLTTENPEYFSFICKDKLGVDLLPEQAIALHEMWNKKYPMIVGPRNSGKTYLLCLYAILKAILVPDRKIVIISHCLGFNKLVQNYITKILEKSPTVNSSLESGLSYSAFTISTSKVFCMIIAESDKIRGMRVNDILFNDFDSQPKELFGSIVHGFSATSDEGDQLIISGNLSHDFNQLSISMKRYKDIIESGGDLDKISQNLLKGSPVPEYFNWEDYLIIRTKEIA